MEQKAVVATSTKQALEQDQRALRRRLAELTAQSYRDPQLLVSPAAAAGSGAGAGFHRPSSRSPTSSESTNSSDSPSPFDYGQSHTHTHTPV